MYVKPPDSRLQVFLIQIMYKVEFFTFDHSLIQKLNESSLLLLHLLSLIMFNMRGDDKCRRLPSARYSLFGS